MADQKRHFTEISTDADDDLSSVPSHLPLKIARSTKMATSAIKKVNNAFLSNRFDGLPVEEHHHANQPNSSEQPNKARKIKIPPIVVRELKYIGVKQILTKLNIANYSTKFMSTGIQIFVSDVESYDKLIAELTETNAKFYTYTLPSKIPIKVVLSGLPMFDTKEVKDAINNNTAELNLRCVDVIVMKTKTNPTHKRHSEFALYLAYFERNQFSMKALQSIKYLLHVSIKWNTFKRRIGPSQCSNCQEFGHVNTNCNLQIRCRLCGEQHDENDCIHIDSYEEGIYVSVKCTNCNGNHPSNSPACTARENFIQMRQQLARRANNRGQRRMAQQLNPYVTYETSFPALQQPRMNHNHVTQLTQRATQPSPPPPSPPPPPQQPPQHSVSTHHTPQQRTPTHQNNEVLFNFNELMQLTQDIISTMRDCRTKYEQFDAISKIAFKYLHNGSP